jgi:PEP-CTERM motif
MATHETIETMRAKYLLVSTIACLFLAIAVVEVRAGQLERVSPPDTGFTIMPITPSGNGGNPPLLGPVNDPNTPNVTAVPEPSIIAMMFLGSGSLGALTALRRRRRG